MTNNGVNLNDPGVKRLLGQSHADELAGGNRQRDLVHLAGDPDHGLSSAIHLDHGKREVAVRYKDFVLTVDVYQVSGEPLCVHLICPRCRKNLRITGDRKGIDFDSRAGDPALGGRLSIEPFECTWEIDSDKNVSLVGSSLNLCRWKAAIENNIARDA